MSNTRNNSFELVARVVSVGAEQTFPSGFRKRELVLCDDDPKFAQTFPVEFTGDRTDNAAAFAPGNHVAVSFSVRGREHNGRHFVTLHGFKIERAVKIGGEPTVGTQTPAPAPAPTTPQPPQPVQAPLPVRDEVEDLPF
jgi:hypothetical protein